MQRLTLHNRILLFSIAFAVAFSSFANDSFSFDLAQNDYAPINWEVDLEEELESLESGCSIETAGQLQYGIFTPEPCRHSNDEECILASNSVILPCVAPRPPPFGKRYV